MTNAITTLGGANKASTAPKAPAASETGGAQGAFSTSVTNANTSTNETAVSPRMFVDPRAGVITQFLSSDGTIELQIPSTVAVAYLRAGLSADGLSKHPVDQGTSQA